MYLEKAKGGKKKTAYDVARDTKLNPIGGQSAKLTANAITQAKAARRVYRKAKTRVDAEMDHLRLKYAEDDTEEQKARRENIRISTNSAAELAATLESDDFGEGEEGEEGEDEGEGGEEDGDDEAGLAA